MHIHYSGLCTTGAWEFIPLTRGFLHLKCGACEIYNSKLSITDISIELQWPKQNSLVLQDKMLANYRVEMLIDDSS